MKESRNMLYPIFLRADRLRFLIIGAGDVGYEKLSFLLKSSPNARVTIIATWKNESIDRLILQNADDVRFIKKTFETYDVIEHDIIIAATNYAEVNQKIHCAAKRYNKIVNVADTPELCDFYMGSIVTRGDLKVAISTNGKSPTFAKRFRQLLEKTLPEESNELINNLKSIRDRLNGSFDYKVKTLNRLTKTLIEHEQY